MSAIACSGSPLASAPFAPSALPALTLSAESGDGDAGATFGTLDKGKDKDKDRTTTTTQTVVEAEGVIATATGTCPARTFTIGTHSITTSAATRYEEGACANLVTLAEIKVRAARQADGTLVATKVEFKDTDEAGDDDGDKDEADDEDETGDGPNPPRGAGPHYGTVSSFRGACPAVTFNLKGLRISTTGATIYEGGTCEMLRPNVQVLVTGAAGTTSRTFVAERVTILRTH